MKYYDINEQFLSRLRIHESRIPFTNYGANSWKPFFGSLFEVDELVYVTNLSSPKPRHYHLKSTLDLVKLYISDEPNPDRLIAVVNLNYMFPVPKKYLTEVDYQVLEGLMPNKSSEDLSKYWDLLNTELEAIDSSRVLENSKKLYEHKSSFPVSPLSSRCFDFKALEIIVKTL